MAAVQAQQGTIGKKVSNYQQQLGQLAQIRNTMQQVARATGDWTTETFKTVSASQRLTKQIVDQKLGAREAFRSWKNGYFKQMIAEQHSLRNAFATQMTSTGMGRGTIDLYAPRGVDRRIRSWTTEIGTYSAAIKSVALQTVNWGKNTQWAGRQMMVGLTVPLGIAAAGMAKQAFDIDKQLTRIAKVYDTQSTLGLEGAAKQVAAENELAIVRANSLDMATNAANTYGAAVKDTLDVEAQLAATGLGGQELTQATTEVVRIATLGELNYQDAINTTISLQTAFKMSNKELTESFNFMNAVENATSLSIQDIAEAVPRAASALSSLGGTVQEMTIMLVAMKESGVNAAEGANAIKSATSRLLNPSDPAIASFKQWGIDIEKVVREADGNIFEIMQTLAALTRNLSDLDRQKAVQELFGTYQFNRATALWSNLGSAIDATGAATNQTGKSMILAGEDVSKWADTAATEMQRYQQSVSGRFKRAVEGFKAELVPLGITILGMVTPVLEGLRGIVDWFNDLGDTKKKVILWGLAVFGLAGPVVMLTGLMANLLSHVFLKFPAALGAIVARFSPLTAQMTANQIVARRAAMTWDTETSSAAMLTQSITTLTAAMEANAIAQGHMLSTAGVLHTAQPVRGTGGVGTGTPGVSYYRNEGGQLRRRVEDPDTGRVRNTRASETSPEGRRFNAAEAAAAARSQNQIEQSSARTRMSWQSTAGALAGVGMAVGAFMMMDTSSASIGQNLMVAAMFASSAAMILPSLRGSAAMAGRLGNVLGGNKFAAFGTKVGSWATGMGAAAASSTRFAGAAPAITRIGGALTRILPMVLRVFGPIGIIAGGIALIVTLKNHMTELSRRQDDINKSAKDWANILGYVQQQGVYNGAADGSSGGGFARLTQDAEALKEANEGLGDALSEAGVKADNFETAYRMAVSEALKVVTSGGTADQARHAFEVALRAAGAGLQTITDLRVRFDKINLENKTEVVNAIKDEIAAEIDRVAPEGANGFMRFFMNDLNDEGEAGMKAAGAAAARAFYQGASVRDQGLVLDNVTTEMNDQFSGAFRNITNQLDEEGKAKFRELGISNMTELTTAMRETQKDGSMDVFDWRDTFGDGWRDTEKTLDTWHEAVVNMFKGMQAEGLITEDQLDTLADALGGLTDIEELKNVLQMPDPKSFMTARDAQAAYNLGIAESTALGEEFTAEQQLASLNVWRAAAGLDAATDISQGFARGTSDAAQSAEELAAAEADAAAEASRLTNALKSAMSGSWSDIFKEADDALQAANQAEIDGIQRGGEATQKNLEKRGQDQEKAYELEEEALKNSWDNREKIEEDGFDNQIKTIEDSADARIAAIDATMDAEEEAEDRRKKIFEAEQRRLQRMAEMANQNIDFNAALNSGNLDEAAKLLNSGMSQTAQWALDDAGMTADAQAEKRRKGQETEKDRIESERDTQVAAVEATRDARLEALKVEREAEEKALEDRKKASQEEIRLAQETARESTQAAVDSAKAKQEADRKALEMELAALREYVPQNEADLQAHIGRVQDAYAKYGHGLQMSGDNWSKIIGDALTTNVAKSAAAMQSEINWEQIGTYISENIGKGTGMNANAVVEFLRTGKFPDQPASGTAAWKPTYPIGTKVGNNTYLGNGKWKAPGGVTFEHSGGEINPSWSAKDRTGVPRKASLYPSEVPTVLKKGEFVVDTQGTKHNRDLLEKINGSSKSVAGAMQYEGVKHSGGIMDSVGAMAGMYGAALAKIQEVVGIQKIKQAQEARLAASFGASGSFDPGAMGGGGSNGVFHTSKGGWPARQWMKESPNATAAKKFVQQTWGNQINGVGTVGSRSITSDHPWGKALDVMMTKPGATHYKQPGGIALGTQIADWFMQNPNVFGTKYVIWRDRIAENDGRGWQRYGHPSGGGGDTLQHRDHPHISLLHKGGLAGKSGFSAPQLDVGGKVMYDNTLANLHKNETMLTAPLSRDLESGIKNLDLNRANEYNVEVNFNGPVNSQIDFEKGVYKAIEKKESRNGKTRKVTLT